MYVQYITTVIARKSQLIKSSNAEAHMCKTGADDFGLFQTEGVQKQLLNCSADQKKVINDTICFFGRAASTLFSVQCASSFAATRTAASRAQLERADEISRSYPLNWLPHMTSC